MANLLTRLLGRSETTRSHSVISWDDYQHMLSDMFTFGGVDFPILNQSYQPGRVEEPDQAFSAQMELMKQVPPAFAAQLVRAMVLSQAKFTFRRTAASRQGPPGSLFGTQALRPLERPWPNATTGELISRMEWHAGLEGNAFVVRQPGRLRLLRPDWVWMFYGSNRDPDDPLWELDAELAGYAYQKGGGGASGARPELLLPEGVAHWSPIPDPEVPGRGMSWFTPAVREALGDRAVTQHKHMFFKQGATPNLVVKGVNVNGNTPTPQQFKEIVGQLEEQHSGLRKAYKTLYLTAGADATVVGSNLKDLDLKSVQGGFETRIAYLSRVPAVVLNIAEGLSGSSLNAGNYSQSRRNFADTWVYPTLQDLSGALASIIPVPADAELWFDVDGMPFMRQDAKDAAEITKIQAETITRLVREGFTDESSKAAVISGDMALLEHTGLVSVQLQPPGTVLGASAPGTAPRFIQVPPGVLPPPPKALKRGPDDDQD